MVNERQTALTLALFCIASYVELLVLFTDLTRVLRLSLDGQTSSVWYTPTKQPKVSTTSFNTRITLHQDRWCRKVTAVPNADSCPKENWSDKKRSYRIQGPTIPWTTSGSWLTLRNEEYTCGKTPRQVTLLPPNTIRIFTDQIRQVLPNKHTPLHLREPIIPPWGEEFPSILHPPVRRCTGNRCLVPTRRLFPSTTDGGRCLLFVLSKWQIPWRWPHRTLSAPRIIWPNVLRRRIALASTIWITRYRYRIGVGTHAASNECVLVSLHQRPSSPPLTILPYPQPRKSNSFDRVNIPFTVDIDRAFILTKYCG